MPQLKMTDLDLYWRKRNHRYKQWNNSIWGDQFQCDGDTVKETWAGANNKDIKYFHYSTTSFFKYLHGFFT